MFLKRILDALGGLSFAVSRRMFSQQNEKILTGPISPVAPHIKRQARHPQPHFSLSGTYPQLITNKLMQNQLQFS